MKRSLDTEAASILSDLKGIASRIGTLQADPQYTQALRAVVKAIDHMKVGTSDIDYALAREMQQRMREIGYPLPHAPRLDALAVADGTRTRGSKGRSL
jgi:hypothetical protein